MLIESSKESRIDAWNVLLKPARLHLISQKGPARLFSFIERSFGWATETDPFLRISFKLAS